MKILVTAASKHGSTAEIADAIAKTLEKAGHTVDVFTPKDAPPADAYHAAVIGSAIYAGSWQGAAREYIDANQAALRKMPVWLFSSGPLGADDPQPQDPPTQLEELLQKTGARAHQIFVGKLDKEQLGFGEKLIVKAVKAPYGDFRDWEAIRSWAQEIAVELASIPV